MLAAPKEGQHNRHFVTSCYNRFVTSLSTSSKVRLPNPANREPSSKSEPGQQHRGNRSQTQEHSLKEEDPENRVAELGTLVGERFGKGGEGQAVEGRSRATAGEGGEVEVMACDIPRGVY